MRTKLIRRITLLTLVLTLSLTAFTIGTSFALAIGCAVLVQGVARMFVDRAPVRP